MLRNFKLLRNISESFRLSLKITHVSQEYFRKSDISILDILKLEMQYIFVTRN